MIIDHHRIRHTCSFTIYIVARLLRCLNKEEINGKGQMESKSVMPDGVWQVAAQEAIISGHSPVILHIKLQKNISMQDAHNICCPLIVLKVTLISSFSRCLRLYTQM
jgi:hypothetical protein